MTVIPKFLMIYFISLLAWRVNAMQVSSRVLLTCTYSVLHEETGQREKYNVDKADDDKDEHMNVNTNSY